MGTKLKKPEPRIRGEWESVAPLPIGMPVFLRTEQVRLALGAISENYFAELRRGSEFPKPDDRQGKLLMWHSDTIRDYINKRKAEHNDGVGSETE